MAQCCSKKSADYISIATTRPETILLGDRVPLRSPPGRTRRFIAAIVGKSCAKSPFGAERIPPSDPDQSR